MKVIIEGIKGIQKVYSMLVGSCWHHNILQPSQKHSASRIHPARAFSVSHWGPAGHRPRFQWPGTAVHSSSPMVQKCLGLWRWAKRGAGSKLLHREKATSPLPLLLRLHRVASDSSWNFTNFTISLSFPTSVSSHQQVQGGIAGRLTPPSLVH